MRLFFLLFLFYYSSFAEECIDERFDLNNRRLINQKGIYLVSSSDISFFSHDAYNGMDGDILKIAAETTEGYVVRVDGKFYKIPVRDYLNWQRHEKVCDQRQGFRYARISFSGKVLPIGIRENGLATAAHDYTISIQI